jgi:hypothetical protein
MTSLAPSCADSDEGRETWVTAIRALRRILKLRCVDAYEETAAPAHVTERPASQQP